MLALLNILGPILGNVLDKVLPDPQAKAKAQTEILAALAASDLAQLEVNKAEAAHRSIFVAGWRPAVGWSCAIGVAYEFLLRPLLIYVGEMLIAFGTIPTVAHPPSISAVLMELLLILLGVGGLRTIEKLRGVA